MSATRPLAAGAGSVAALVALAATVGGCAQRRPQRQTAATTTPYVQTAIATYGSVRPTNTLAGVIAPYQNVAIQNTLAEPAVSVNVQEGDRVSKGEVLAQLDTSDLQAQLQQDLATAQSNRANTTHNVYQGNLNIAQAQDALRGAQSAVRQAQANLQRDQADLARYQSLYASGYVSQQQLVQTQTTVRNDEQAVRQAQASLASTQSSVNLNGSTESGTGLQGSAVQQSAATVAVALAQAQQVRVQIAKATITSPIDGVVVNRNLNPGEYPGNRQIFTLQQVDPIYAVLRGTATQVADISAGSIATIETSDARHSRRTGRVVGVLNEIAPGSTDFQVKVVLSNGDGSLRPGAVVQSIIPTPPISGIRIPTTAFTDDNHTMVLLVGDDNVVKTAHVRELGADANTSIVVGLQPQARVVANGQTSVGDGEKVVVR